MKSSSSSAPDAFPWLSGDDVAQSLVHNVDRATWIMREQTPLKAHGLGGRSASFGEIYGNMFDHHSVVYEYANGVRMYAFCRTQNGCYSECSSDLPGHEGPLHFLRAAHRGGDQLEIPGPGGNPYDIEHQRLFGAIRSGKPVNAGDYMARSTLVAVMGQLACYSGEELTWERMRSRTSSFCPRPRTCGSTWGRRCRPDAAGNYPVPMPGHHEVQNLTCAGRSPGSAATSRHRPPFVPAGPVPMATKCR